MSRRGRSEETIQSNWRLRDNESATKLLFMLLAIRLAEKGHNRIYHIIIYSWYKITRICDPTKVVNSNPVHGKVYSIQHYVINLSATCDRSVVFPLSATL